MPGKKSTPAANMTAQDIQDANRYQKMEQREHVYKRPDTYVGSVEHNTSIVPIFVDAANETAKEQIRPTKIEYVPALYKIFDEVLVNAIDQHTRLFDEWVSAKTKAKRAKIKLAVVIHSLKTGAPFSFSFSSLSSISKLNVEVAKRKNIPAKNTANQKIHPKNVNILTLLL